MSLHGMLLHAVHEHKWNWSKEWEPEELIKYSMERNQYSREKVHSHFIEYHEHKHQQMQPGDEDYHSHE